MKSVCDDGDGDGDGPPLLNGLVTDCCDIGLLLLVKRSTKGDGLWLSCPLPSLLMIDAVGDVAKNGLKPELRANVLLQPNVDDDALDAFESLPGDGIAIDSRRATC